MRLRNATHQTPIAVSVTEAAAMLAIGRSSMYELMTSGEIKTVHIGKRRVVPVIELQRYVEKAMVSDEASHV